MAEHTYVKYINADGMSQASPEGAIMKDTITMDGPKIVRSVITAVTDKDREAWRRENGGDSGSTEESGGKVDE